MVVGRAVLIVEDEFLIAMDLKLILQGRGWDVIGPAPTVRSALGLLAGSSPAVAVLDIHLGRELVTPVADALRARGIPFVIASAYAFPEEIGGDPLGGAPNVGKPTTEHRLISALEQLLA